MKFSGKIAHTTKKNLEHFWVVVINPLNSGSIFLFCKSVIVSTIKEKLMNGFSLIFLWYIGHDTKKIDRLFHAWLDCFTVSHLGAAVCLLAILWTNRFSWNFQDISAMTWGTTWKNCGGDALNTLKTGFIFWLRFFSPFFATLGINGWMNIQNMN